MVLATGSNKSNDKMKTIFFILLFFTSIYADIGHYNFTFEGQAFNQTIRALVKPPGVVPGIANITIVNNEACPNCDEDLNLIAASYELPDDSGLESTDVYAFYTDSLGNPPELNSFMTLIETSKTQERIKYTLVTGKPLVN